MRRLLIVVALLALAGCGGDDEDAATDTTAAEETTTTAASEEPTTSADVRADCTKVEDATILEGIKQTEAWAAKAPRGARISRNNQAWYVASSGGALWVTNIQPDAENDGGLTLAVNDEARAASDIGTAASPDAPAYEGLKLSDPGAVQALECAGA